MSSILEKLKQSRQNPLLKKVKDGDIVKQIGRNKFGTDLINLIKVTNVEFIPAGVPDTKAGVLDCDWLEYDAEVLYTNKRMHSSWLKKGPLGPLDIVEIVPEELVDNYVKNFNLFDAEKYALTDEEAESYKNRSIGNMI